MTSCGLHRSEVSAVCTPSPVLALLPAMAQLTGGTSIVAPQVAPPVVELELPQLATVPATQTPAPELLPTPTPISQPAVAPEPRPDAPVSAIASRGDAILHHVREPPTPVPEPVPEPDSGTRSVDVTVPEGLIAGDTISLELPDGTEIDIDIPEGVAAGDVFDVFEVELDDEDAADGDQESEEAAGVGHR